MATRHIYPMGGGAVYFQQGQYIYNAGSSVCEFYQSGNYWYKMNGKAAAMNTSSKENTSIRRPEGRRSFTDEPHLTSSRRAYLAGIIRLSAEGAMRVKVSR